MFTGGVSTVSFDATGQHLLTAGNDGAVVLHTVQPSRDDTSANQLPEQPASLGTMTDVDAVDEDAEPTEVGLLKQAVLVMLFVYRESYSGGGFKPEACMQLTA